jgi:hypothetical protein
MRMLIRIRPMDQALDADPALAEHLGKLLSDFSAALCSQGRHAEVIPHLEAAFGVGGWDSQLGVEVAPALASAYAAVGRLDDSLAIDEELARRHIWRVVLSIVRKIAMP